MPPQGLLGGIAELSQQQEGLERQLALLDGSIASLAAAIPAAQAAGAPPAAGSACLECSLRLLALRPRALGCSHGGSGQVLALELRLHNRSSVALAGGWSVLLQHSTGGTFAGGQDSTGSTVLAAPLGCLAAGAAWQRECEVPLPAAASCIGGTAGRLRVLLCRHGWEGMASSTLLLHAVPLDALHVLQLESGGGLPSGQSLQQQAAAGSPPDGSPAAGLQVRMQLQLPAAMCSVQLSAASLLQQMLQQGLSSRPQPPAEERQQATVAAPSPAFGLLQLAAQTQPGSAGSGSRSSSLGGGRLSLEATQLQSATALQQTQRVQVAGTAVDAATALACHQGMCWRVLQMQAGAAAAQQQPHTQPPWPRVPGRDGLLLPPALPAAALPAPFAAAAGIDEAALEQALLQLRQLQAAAIQLRRATAADGGRGHAARELQRAEAERLAVDVRRSLAAVPVLLC